MAVRFLIKSPKSSGDGNIISPLDKKINTFRKDFLEMSEKQLQTINENNAKVKAVLEVMTEALAGNLNVDLISMVDIVKDYTDSTDKIVSRFV